ncbi:hypothetical protein ACFLZO_01010 [Patescibacteria group bacterium]
MHMLKDKKKLIMTIGVGIGVAVLVSAAGYLGYRTLSGGDDLEEITLELEDMGDLDLSLSPLGTAELPVLSFEDISFGLDLSSFGTETSIDTSLSVPGVDIPAPTATGMTDFSFDLSGMQSMAASQGPPASVPSAPEGEPPSSEEPPPQSQVNSANCAQFSSMPSAQYCNMVGDPNGQVLCQDCKAAGF